MEDELITVADAAQELGKNKQHVFKVLDRLNIKRSLQKSALGHGQKVACITRLDLERLREHFTESQPAATPSEQPDRYIDSQSAGVFYLIQLEPELDPERFKLGFATNIDERLRSHRTAAPLCRVLRTWPCKLLWEKTAIEFITPGCERLHTEVFRAESIEATEKRCEQFFSLAPVLSGDDEYKT